MTAKAKRMGDTVFKARAAMDPCYIGQAVAETWDLYENENRTPGASVYEWDTRKHRQNMLADVESRYRELSGLRGVFPYHDDQIVMLWIQYRKSRDAYREAFGL